MILNIWVIMQLNRWITLQYIEKDSLNTKGFAAEVKIRAFLSEHSYHASMTKNVH